MEPFARMSWGDVAVIRDSSRSSSADEPPLQFVKIGIQHQEEGEMACPPPAIEDTSDESSTDESLEGEALLTPLHGDAACCSKRDHESKCTKATVSFGTIEIREYSLTIGTNTPTNIMYPLSLDWAFTENTPLKLDEYEALRRKKRLEGSMPSLSPSINRRSKFRAPRRLDVTDRMVRLSQVTGRTSHALFTEERMRQLRLMEENRRASLGLGPMLFCT